MVGDKCFRCRKRMNLHIRAYQRVAARYFNYCVKGMRCCSRQRGGQLVLLGKVDERALEQLHRLAPWCHSHIAGKDQRVG